MLSKAAQLLVSGYRSESLAKERQEGEITIHVDEIAAKIAKFYESIRNVLDYREEHLIRKNCIFRALQRGLLMKGSEPIAESLIRDIIRGGHLPNDAIPEKKIAEVERIISNLRFMLHSADSLSARARLEISQWLERVASCAIEEYLDPPIKDKAMADAMYAAFGEKLIVKGAEMSVSEKNAQLFIGIQKALLRVDEDQLAWRLLKLIYPSWEDPAAEEQSSIAASLPDIKSAIDRYMAHPLGAKFFTFCNRYNAVFLILGDAVFDRKNFLGDPESMLADEKRLAKAVEEAYVARYDRQKRRLRRIAFFAITSLFITKVLVAFAVEIPIDIWLNQYSLLYTGINAIFPPVLMFLIIALIQLPSKDNIRLVEKEVKAAVYEDRRKDYVLAIPKLPSRWLMALVRLFYMLVSIGVLWETARMLRLAGFSYASVVVFILFTSIVAATGVRMQNRSKEISIEERKSGILSFLADLVFMPFVTIGQITIAGLAKFKFLVIMVNLIDVPFQGFVQFVESLSVFLRGKKDELH
jgi:hypothetical protein